jgi:hypothetical protein
MGALRVCVDAGVPGSGTIGGVDQVMISLASELSSLADSDEEYLFLTYPDAAEWLRPETDVPTIYHPHDLQHVHLPEFFTGRERIVREFNYRTCCEQARMVGVASS